MTRVLYIEDDESVAGLFKTVVETRGYSVDVAFTGDGGLAMHAANPYDILAVDYGLPDMTGIDVCRKLLMDDPELPIVMITGKGNQGLIAEALSLGVAQYLQKDNPGVYLELVPSIIEHLVRQSRIGQENRKSNQILLETERKLKQATELTHVGYWVWDEIADKAVSCSEEYAKIHDVSVEEFVSNSNSSAQILDRVHPEDREAIKEINRKYRKNYKPYNMEYRIVTRQGETRWVRDIVEPVFDENGVHIRTNGFTQDITDRKHVEAVLSEKNSELLKSEEQLRAMFETGAVGIAFHSLDGAYLKVNEAFCQILGCDQSEILGRNWRDFTHPDDIARTEREDAETINRKQDSFSLEKRYVRKGGETIWAHLGSAHLFDAHGRPEFIVGHIVDITEQKLNEQALQETQDQLQANIAGLKDAKQRIEHEGANQVAMAEDLAIARDEADAANKSKSEFLASMSHEIRTPMTGVIGFADLLLEDDLAVESKEKVYKIKDSAHSLLKIINDILDMSKMEAGKMDIEGIDCHLPSMIDDVVALFSEKRKDGRAKGLELDVNLSDDFPVGVNCDPTRLRQILVNLIGNAVKFTEKGSVTVEGSCQSENGQEFIRMAVHDTGIGMQPEVIDKLFTSFTQADATITRRFEGTGLGLSICRRLTGLMGGKIGAESEYGKGSTFWFTLPYTLATTEVSARSTGLSSMAKVYKAAHFLRILIVDDNKLNQQIIFATVAGFGHSAIIKENGMEEIEAHEAGDFDLILMDVRMPVMSGPDATRTIRAMGKDKAKIPIIAL
ncbi:MAG: PAS domain S-box protein, partial [Rhodospirillaceae bacterium]|nr:PAS domain S-box protein [Rhodospirillaceae bacterium]